MTKECPRCEGKGGLWSVIKPIHGKSDPRDRHYQYHTCPQIGCNQGQVDTEAYYRSFQCTSITVVA